MDKQISELAAEVRKSRKYAQIEPGLVSRLVGEELAKGRKPKEVVKNVRSKLHQVGGAYLDTAPNYEIWLRELRAAQDPNEFKQVCRMVMSRHASTRERLPFLEDFYRQIFGLLPPIGSLLDVACGLNPLAVPWMPMDDSMVYHACDMYADMAGFLNAFFARVHIDGYCQVCDVAAAPPSQQVDLALVLKSIPCLEQTDKQAGTRLLAGLNARYLAISFPAKSLGGRKKGMVENYSARFEELTAGRGWLLLGRLEFETELVFVVES
jgi:16S rRNA (guanine(1405)-N(7))-methyltransferase